MKNCPAAPMRTPAASPYTPYVFVRRTVARMMTTFCTVDVNAGRTNCLLAFSTPVEMAVNVRKIILGIMMRVSSTARSS